MRSIRFGGIIAICLCCSVLAASRAHYVRYADVNWEAVVGAPPALASVEQKREIQQLLALQGQRTAAQEKRCRSEVVTNVFYFSRVLGAKFNQHELPVTGEVLKDAAADATEIGDALKRHWNRQRPYLTDRRIEPCVPMEKATSYPSGHAMRGMLWATILSEMFPDKRQELMVAGRQLGEDRVIAGVHYPSDVAAGQKLGAAIAEKLLANRDFRTELEKARTECAAAFH